VTTINPRARRRDSDPDDQEVRHLVLKQGAVAVKFVNVAGNYRFHLPQYEWIHHEDLLKEDETPTSAGFFMLYTVTDTVHVKLLTQESISLRLGPAPDDQENLERLFT
jgi:hypothetical protein